MALDAGTSTAKKRPIQPKCSTASSGETEVTGTSRWRPMTSAISRVGTPSSPTPWSTEPAGADSTASRKSRAASSRCTAGQRFAPSPT